MSNPNMPDLPADTLWYERAALMGALTSWMTFGMICVVFLQTMLLLVEEPVRRGAKRNWSLIIFTSVMFSLAVSFEGLYTRNLQLEFIDNRDYPGGPMAWGRTQYGSPRLASSDVISVVISWLADGFLLYRCLVIFRFKLFILLSLATLYLANMISSIFFLVDSMQPGASLYSPQTVNWGIARMVLIAALNIILAILITARLLFFRQRLRKALGGSQALSVPYVSIAAMVIESSMICALSYLALAIPYAMNSHAANIFLPSCFLMPVLSTILISMRVASRRAWDARTMTVNGTPSLASSRELTTLKFINVAEGLETCQVVVDDSLATVDHGHPHTSDIMRRIAGALEDDVQPGLEKV